MKKLLDKYAVKMVSAGLADEGIPLLGGLDADLIWNKDDEACELLKEVFDGLNINSLLYSRPAEPYATIIDYLCRTSDGAIRPSDCETRTFLHDLPFIDKLSSSEIVKTLNQRKSVIIPEYGIVTFGTVSPEQAFVVYSSVCFACFVKFFADYLEAAQNGNVNEELQQTYQFAKERIDPLPYSPPGLMVHPNSIEDVYAAISEAGRKTVEYRLVDSFFGNVSMRFNDILYISQTGSSLDEMEGCIDPCPLDGSSCAGITSSSEFTAHRETILETGNHAMLHGHPKFSVIMSMQCDKTGICDIERDCHRSCPEDRYIGDIPIVPGEVGTGKFGLCNTLPAAMKKARGAIVYGHGLFTHAKDDFNIAFENLLNIEDMCRKKYFESVKSALFKVEPGALSK